MGGDKEVFPQAGLMFMGLAHLLYPNSGIIRHFEDAQMLAQKRFYSHNGISFPAWEGIIKGRPDGYSSATGKRR
jgi:hypothetical protein